MSDPPTASTPSPERTPHELLDRAARTRGWMLAGGGLFLAAAVAMLVRTGDALFLALGLACAGWLISLITHLLTPSGSTAQTLPHFGTGAWTGVVGGTALGSTARVYSAIASETLLPEQTRVEAFRAWRVCRYGAMATTAAGALLVGAVSMAVLYVVREASQVNPAGWYFLAPFVVLALGGFVVLCFNGAVALLCGLFALIIVDHR